MKRFKFIPIFTVFCLLFFSIAGCTNGSSPNSGDVSVEESGGYAPAPYSESKTGEMGYMDAPEGMRAELNKTDTASDISDGEKDGETVTDTENQAGLITASAWNDNQYYSAWKDLFSQGQTEEENGKFSSYYESNRWGFDTLNRVVVTVKNGESVIAGATVSYFDENQKEYAAVTNAQGKAYLFPPVEEGSIKVTVGTTEKTAAFSKDERDLAVDIGTEYAKASIIKLMLVVDVTGSMGDELNYLKTELADVINRVATENQGVRIDLAMLFYRDDEDEEKFSYADFVNVTDANGLQLQQAKLKEQSASGGGDIPEAVDEALELAIGKDWGEENSTKIIFHVLDAPPHSGSVYQTRFTQAVENASKKGIRLCPVLCSGANELCEYLVRNEAVYTGGTFIFVTDHSGIGNPHYDPDLPNAVVEKLNDLMVRLINGYYTGTFADPVPWNAKAKE